jgi:nitrite reductase/ring-hydroxylating ferredoxin subunit
MRPSSMPPSGSVGEPRSELRREGERSLRRARLTFVGRVPRAALEGGAMVRLEWPPFHVLVALVDGVPRAIEDACNHAGASLSEGERCEGRVTCPMHGYIFDLTTGHLVEPRGLCDDQRSFVARIEGEHVAVWDPGAGIAIALP